MSTRISKKMSYLLRHDQNFCNAHMSEQGWVLIPALVDAVSSSEETVRQIVLDDTKGRYSIEGDRIRANQGHSTNVKIDFVEKEPPEFLYHGTGVKFVEVIKQEGLKPMSRQYVHLSSDYHTATKVGSRKGKPVILKVFAKDLYQDGCKFYTSTNGVWLVDYIAPTYFVEMGDD